MTPQRTKDILRKSTPTISKLLISSDNRTSLAVELYGSFLISDEAYFRAIDDAPIPDLQKGTTLMKDIILAVADKPDKLRQFIEVLKSVENFHSLAENFERDINQ